MRVKTDWPLFLTILGMVCFGLVFIYSSSTVIAEQRYGFPSYHFLLRQAVAAVIALGALLFLAKRDYRRLRSPQWAFTLLGMVLALLLIVFFTDPVHKRWLYLGPTQLQPSELAKPVLVVFLAYFVTQRAADINGRHTLVPALMAMMMLGGAVVIADLGTAIVLMGTAGVVFYVAGLERRYFVIAGVASVVLLTAAIVHKPYRLNRVVNYVDPDHRIVNFVDPSGNLDSYMKRAKVGGDPGYQARQSLIAVGSGGVFGQGLMRGTQKLFYLPEAQTDFIFAVVGEELGMFGCSLLLCGFVVILWRGLRLYWIALDDFGRYIALGVTVSIVLQAFINMSVVMDLGPTKGIPLPMISYGGSSLVGTMVSLGLLMSVSERAR
jgi:cell division protein FtsW